MNRVMRRRYQHSHRHNYYTKKYANSYCREKARVALYGVGESKIKEEAKVNLISKFKFTELIFC